MELRFTEAGAVASAEALQVRLDPRFEGRVVAGLPAPSRELTDGELVEAIRVFAEGGPRARRVRRLILSGVAAGRVPSLLAILAHARQLGIQHVTLHAPSSLAPCALPVDAVVIALRDPGDAARLSAFPGVHRVGVIVLDEGASPAARAAEAREAGLDRVTVAWPLPPAGPPLDVAQVPATLDAVAERLGDVPWAVSGLPICLLGPHGDRARRAGNRFYVDADHPPDRALLFFPDVVRWWKADTCRFCAANDRCDGVATRWMQEGRVPRLTPLPPHS